MITTVAAVTAFVWAFGVSPTSKARVGDDNALDYVSASLRQQSQRRNRRNGWNWLAPRLLMSSLSLLLSTFALAGTMSSSQVGGGRQGGLLQLAQTEQLETQKDPSLENEQTNGMLREVVVTAQKRHQDLQKVPISIQVIGARTLHNQNLNSLFDLAETVPSVRIGFNGTSNDLYIRGIGSDESQSFDQSVSTFVDDIYHGRSRTSAATFLDVARVEILRGPQSTFFGNNAIAGALNIITNKPTDTFDAFARTLYGMYGQYAVEGAAGGPITQSFGARVAAIAEGGSGWIENVYTGKHVPKENNKAGRVTLRFTPTADLEAMLKVEGSRNNNSGAVAKQIVNCPPPSPFVPQKACKTALAEGLPIGLNNNESADGKDQGIHLDSSEDVLTVNFKHWGQTFTSVSGYYKYDYSLNYNIDGTPLMQINAEVPEHGQQFSQEFRVASHSDQPFTYLSGIYFQADDVVVHQDISFPFLSPVLSVSLPPLAPYLPLGQDTSFSQRERVYSGFGSASWNVTDKLKLSAGLRGSLDTKDFHWSQFYATATKEYGGFVPLPEPVVPLAEALQLGGPQGAISLTRSDRAWMPSAQIQYQIESAAMVYFSYARGFKAGGFSGADNTGIAANLPFAPEYVNDYEVGLKSKQFNDRLLVDVDLFRSDYRDLQVAVTEVIGATSANPEGTIISLIRNAAAARSQGIEFETQWAVSQNFLLSSAVTLLDAYYVSYRNAGATNLQKLYGVAYQDLSGRPTEFAPRWSGSITASYLMRLPNSYRLTTELMPTFSSSYYLHDTDESFYEQGNYVRLDGRMSFQRGGGPWAIDLIAKNLTDRTILSAIGGGMNLEVKEEPRNVALQFRYDW